jgi:predicted O-methyltransferase YrrM
MWPRIVELWPDATLEVFCDLDHEWTNRIAGDVVMAIRGELAKGLKGVNMRGWVSKADLAAAWMSTDIWLYPCTFAETFCLTALEAAYSRCLIVSSDLAALQNTVGDRGIVIGGNPMTREWQDKALEELFSVGERKQDLIERGSIWASGLTWKGQATKFLDLYCKDAPTMAGMYNWTHDLPKGTRGIFEQMLLRHRGSTPRVLEIGTFAGTSLIEMLKILPEATAVAIDRWANYDEDGITCLATQEQGGIEQVFHENMRRAGMSSRVIALKGDSVDRLLDLIQEKALFDIIYVDGSHKCIDCYTDMALSWRLLKSGGTMIVDDYLYNNKKVGEGLVLEYPMKGVDHFLSKYEGMYRMLNKGYRVCLEKI